MSAEWTHENFAQDGEVGKSPGDGEPGEPAAMGSRWAQLAPRAAGCLLARPASLWRKELQLAHPGKWAAWKEAEMEGVWAAEGTAHPLWPGRGVGVNPVSSSRAEEHEIGAPHGHRL